MSEQHAATITGVLIVQKESVIHLVETSMDTSTALLRQIQSMEAELDPSARVMENVGCFVFKVVDAVLGRIQGKAEELNRAPSARLNGMPRFGRGRVKNACSTGSVHGVN